MKIQWTDGAKDDLIQIRLYLQQHVSPAYAKKITQEIKKEVHSLISSPNRGTYVVELENLNMTDFRQLLAHQNRIIVERTPGIFYVHLVCHTSMSLESLLLRRLLK